MRRFFTGLLGTGQAGEAVPQAEPSNSGWSSPTSPSNEPTRRGSLLRGRGKAKGNASADFIPTMILAAASALGDAIQGIISDTSKLSGDNLSGYETLLCILNDVSELDEPAEVVQARGMGCVQLLISNCDHPRFVELCNQKSLAAGLFQAMRLLRMLEIKQAKILAENPLLTSTACNTFDASFKVCKLLEKLCTQPATIEQIKVNLVKILTFPLCVLPLCGKHIQTHSAAVVQTICRTGFTSQQVWYLHDVQCITHLVRHLHELTSVASETTSSGAISPQHRLSVDSSFSASTFALTLTSTDYLLRGLQAEAEGMWLVALECVVSVISCTVSVGSVLVNDFESASGQKLLTNMLKNCSPDRFLHVLNTIMLLLFDPTKKEEEVQVLSSVASMLSEFLQDIVGVKQSIQPSDTVETLLEVCSQVIDSAELCTANGRIGLQQQEYIIQGMAYSLLTIYSNEPVACVRMEESYRFLPCLLISLPAMLHTEPMAAVLTTLNYVCQCIDSPAKMIITALSACSSVLIHRFIERNTLYKYNNQKNARVTSPFHVQQIELVFTSMEAICRTNKSYVVLFMKVNLFKSILTEPFEKMYQELHSHNQIYGYTEAEVNVGYQRVFERIIALVVDLNDKNSYAAEDIRRSGILLLIKKIMLNSKLSVAFIGSLLRLYEEIAKVDSVHLQEVVMILVELVKELNKDYIKITLIYNSLWRMLVHNEGFYKVFIRENCVEVGLYSLGIVENAFSTELSTHTDVDLVYVYKYITSILRFMSLILFFTIETQYHYNMYLVAYVTIGQGILSSGIFSHHNYKIPGLILCLQFITVFAYDQDIIYSRALDIFQPILPHLAPDILSFLIQKLSFYTRSDIVKRKRIGDIKLVPRFLNTLISSSKSDGSNLPSSFVSECIVGNWHSDSLFEIVRSCVKPIALLADNVSSAETFDADGNPLPLSILSSLDDENCQAPFEDAPYIGIPLYISAQNESGSVASLAMFFNESTVPMPTNAISISCWFRVDHDSSSPESISKSSYGRRPSASLNTMIPILSMESAGSDIHLNIEINPLTSDAIVTCTMRAGASHNERRNASFMEQEMLVFKPSFALSVDGEHWTHCVITMKRVKRFTSSNQVQLALFFNGLPWIPHSNLSNTANNYSPTGPSVNSNVSAQSSQNIGILNFDPLASSQNGEIRVGLPKDTENPAQSGGPTQRIVLQVANVSVYNEQLQMKQIATLFMMGPTYAKIHQSADSPLSESPCTLSTRVLTISNEMHRHALHYIDRLGLQGIEYVDETRPGLESHKEQTTDFEMPVLPVPIAMIHPLFTLPEHIAFQAFTHRPGLGSALGDSMLSAAEEDVVGEDILSTKARLLRYTLVNIADLENGIPLATLSSGGYISRSMSVGDCASSLGGPDLFLPLLLYAHSEDMLSAVLNIFRQHLLINSASLRYMQHTGYRIMAFILSHANKDILTLRILEQLLRFSVSASYTGLRISSESLLLVDQTALLQLICNHHVWGLQRFSMVSSILSFLKSLVCDEKYGALNALKLSSVGIVRWVLHSCLHVVQGAVTVSDPSIRIDTTADVWVYGSRSACEFADYRDETIPFLAMGMEVVMAVLGSEVRGKDIDLIISIILYTFVQTTTNGKDDPAASAGNDSDRPGIHEVNTGVGSEEIRKAQAEMWQSHPFCTYENIHNLSGSDNPLNSPSSQIRYIQPLEVYRVYLLRLLFKVYDDSLEEQRRPNRRPSNPRSSGNSSKDAANNTSNPNVSNAGAGGEFDICLLFRQIVPAHILLGVLEQSTDVASIAFTLRLLVYLIQKDPLFHKDFIGMKGYQILYTFVTQQVYIAIPVLLPLISLLFRIPIHLVMYPYQIKTAGKIIHLIDLEESVGPNTQDSALMEQTLPLLYIYYECIGHSIKYYMHHNLQTGNESEVYLTKYLSACESLVLSMMDHALDNSASFRYIYQHMFAIELHINTILTCSNAYSEYGSIIYDSATTGSSASSPGAHPDLSAFIQDNYLDSNQPSVREAAINLEEGNGEGSKQMDLSIHHPLGDRLIRQFEKIMFILLKEFDYSKLLYYIFTIYNAHTYTHSFFRGYQQLMMQCYTNVVSRSILENTSNNSLDYALLVAINKNITFLLPLLKGNLFYLENMFHLLFVQMELFKKHTVVFKNLLASNKNVNSQLNSQITLDMHQNLIRDMNSNLRCLIIFNLHNNPVSSPSFSAELRYKLLTFIKDNIDFIFYYVCEDQIDINILKYVNTNKGSVLNNEDKSINQFSSSNMQVLEALQNMAGSSSARYNNKMVLMNSLPILSSGQVQMLHHIPHTSNAAAGINTFKGERSKILNVFIIYILSYTYNLVLEEDTATRIQATRIIAYMANLRKYYIELLCSNNANITANMSSNTGANIALSPGKQTSGSSKMIKGSVLFTEESESNTFSLSYSSASSFGRAPSQSLTSSNSFSNPQSSGKSGVIDLYKDGICKLIPNSLGQYDLDLRSRLTTGAAEESESDLEDRFEESRFADFSYFISEYAYITDKLFAIFNNILTSVLPNTNQDSLDMQKVIKQQLHVFDLWSIIYQDLSSGSTIGNNVTSGGANAAGLASMTGNTLSISNQNPFNAQIYSSIQTFQHNLSTLNTLPGSPSKASQQNSHSLLASAESLQTAYLRLIILNKIGEKVMKMSLYWFREGIREIVAGGCNWKKVYHQCLSNPIWGHRIHSVYHNMQKNAHIYVHRDYQPVGSSSSPNPAVSYNRLYKSIYYHLAHYPSDLVIYKLDYVHGLEHTRRKIKRDFNNYANTFYYRVLQENIAAPQAEQEVQEDALATKKLFLPKKLKMKMNNSSTVQDEEVVDSAVMDDDEDAYDPTALLLEPATVEIDEDNSPSILESSIKIESHVDTNNSHTVKSNEDDLHMSKSSANANAPSISVGSGVVLATGNSEAQYKSLMIKEILRGIISNSNELKKCSFYNIERIYGLETQKALLIVGANYIHVISNFRVVHANASTISTAAAIQKPFAETAFEYTPSKKMPTNKASGGTGNMSSNSAMDEKYIQLNNIHNENIPAMQSSNYASYNNTIKDLYSNSNSQLHQQKEWMEDLWIEMLEMETFYDKIKIDEVILSLFCSYLPEFHVFMLYLVDTFIFPAKEPT